jgi:hypothetical protein
LPSTAAAPAIIPLFTEKQKVQPVGQQGNGFLENFQSPEQLEHLFKSTHSSLIVHVHSLLEVTSQKSYGTLKTKPGMEGYLLRHPENESLYYFKQADEIAPGSEPLMVTGNQITADLVGKNKSNISK